MKTRWMPQSTIRCALIISSSWIACGLMSCADESPKPVTPPVGVTPKPPIEEPPPPQHEPAEKSASAELAATTAKVVLGDPSLTQGISGAGPLTVEQIKTWQATPGINQTLEFDLPRGLAAGTKNIYIPENNPLTRAKIELGRQLYFDGRLSADGKISCASCHSPAEGFGAHTQFGVGVKGQTGGRNSPVSYNRILSKEQFWDGRADSLEAQAVGPIQNPIEMGNTHEQAVKTVAGIEGYRLQFTAVFGPDSVNIDNVGKAIATFERTIVSSPAPYDYYNTLKPFLDRYPTSEELDELKKDEPETFAQYEKAKAESEAHPISESAVRGLKLFFSDTAKCTACHAGANFTDEKYHNIGIGMKAEKPDLGRFEISKDEKETGAFKTPTIRNVELSAPYMHDGSLKTLEEVVEWYAKGGHPNPHLSDKIKELKLDVQQKADLVAFMKACTGSFPKIETARLPE